MAGLVLIVLVASFAPTTSAAATDSCPNGGGWTKVDSSDLSLYPVPGATDYCFKFGSANSNGCTGGTSSSWPPPGISKPCGLSHWSYYVPSNTQPTNTATNTSAPTATNTDLPTATLENTPTATGQPTDEPTATTGPSNTPVDTPSDPTNTPEHTMTPGDTPVATTTGTPSPPDDPKDPPNWQWCIDLYNGLGDPNKNVWEIDSCARHLRNSAGNDYLETFWLLLKQKLGW